MVQWVKRQPQSVEMWDWTPGTHITAKCNGCICISGAPMVRWKEGQENPQKLTCQLAQSMHPHHPRLSSGLHMWAMACLCLLSHIILHMYSHTHTHIFTSLKISFQQSIYITFYARDKDPKICREIIHVYLFFWSQFHEVFRVTLGRQYHTQGSHERWQETERESLPLDISGERTPSLKSARAQDGDPCREL